MIFALNSAWRYGLALWADARRLARGRSLVRSAILIFLAILVFDATPARAQRPWLETRMIGAICNGKSTPADNTDRLAKRLDLTDPQKAALQDLSDASASAAA